MFFATLFMWLHLQASLQLWQLCNFMFSPLFVLPSTSLPLMSGKWSCMCLRRKYSLTKLMPQYLQEKFLNILRPVGSPPRILSFSSTTFCVLGRVKEFTWKTLVMLSMAMLQDHISILNRKYLHRILWFLVIHLEIGFGQSRLIHKIKNGLHQHSENLLWEQIPVPCYC